MAYRESMPSPEKGMDYPEASQRDLEGRGWTPELLKQGAERLNALAEDGFARMNVPTISNVSEGGVTLDRHSLKSVIVGFPDKTRRALAAGAAVLTMGGVGAARILDAGAGLAAEEPAVHEIVMKPGTKTYSIPPGAEEIEVRLNGKNADIGDDVAGYQKTTRNGKIIYRVKTPNEFNTLTLNITPAASKSVDVGIFATTSTERDLQLFESTSGEMKFLAGASTPEGGGLASYALIESVIGGNETKRGSAREAWYMPLNVRVLNNYPQSDTAGIGFSSGYAFVSDEGLIRKAGIEIGGIYDPKEKKMLAGKEGLIALSFQSRIGRAGLNAEALTTVTSGPSAKGAGEVTFDYATLPDRGEGSEVRLGVGFGYRGADDKASEVRYVTLPVTWRTALGAVKGGPEINVDTGDVRVAGGIKVDTGRIVKAAGPSWKEFTQWVGSIGKPSSDRTENTKKQKQENK